jgi:hypothetical protein
LAFKTLGGTEVALQTILRIDHEFFVMKGRLAGTQDAGRVFFIPYNQIDHLYYQKEVRDSDFSAAFDTLTMPPPGTEAALAAAVPIDVPVVEQAVPEPEPEAAAVNRPTPVPIKSAVLERFRSRAPSSSSSINLRPSPD